MAATVYYDFEPGSWSDGQLVADSISGLLFQGYTADGAAYFADYSSGNYGEEFFWDGFGIIGTTDFQVKFLLSNVRNVKLSYSSSDVFRIYAYDLFDNVLASVEGEANTNTGSMRDIEFYSENPVSYIAMWGETSDAWFIDNMSLTMVPEPAAVFAVSTGIIGIFGIFRRRYHN